MARQLRLEFPGAIYHVSCRMIGDSRIDRSRLFTDDRDRQRFVDRLGERVEQFEIRLYLFVLMTNHFHLVFETPAGHCSRFMQSLCTAYTVYYNLRHGRHGHVLDGRYKAKVVEGDAYLLALTRYVHLNPVYAGPARGWPLKQRVEYLRRYPWSSYPGYIGRDEPYGFVTRGPVLAMMPGPAQRRPARYRALVEGALKTCDEEFRKEMSASPRSVGSETFRAWVDEQYWRLKQARSVPEDVAFRRRTEPLDPEQILSVVSRTLGVASSALRERRRSSSLRAVAARMLLHYGGLTQRAAAHHLAMGTGGAVSAQVRRLPGLMSDDVKLKRQVARIEAELLARRTADSSAPSVRLAKY